MPRRFLALNLALAVAAALLAVYIVRQFLAPMPLPVGGGRAGSPAPVAAVVEPPRPAGAYSVVAAKNLFSPTRTEAPAGTVTAGGPLVKPNLYGVVVRETGSIAYLEDPTTKRVAGYRVGDRILGGTVQTIKADSIVIDSPGGALDVRLRDSSKPRAQPAAAPAATAVPPVPGVPVLPGMIPPAAATPASPQVAPPSGLPGTTPGGVPGAAPGVTPGGQPPTFAPGQPAVPPMIPGRRPLPPNLLRRLPPGMGDAPRQ
jgi:hypothetical protein